MSEGPVKPRRMSPEARLGRFERAAFDRINALFAAHRTGAVTAYVPMIFNPDTGLELLIACPPDGWPDPQFPNIVVEHYAFRQLVNGGWVDNERLARLPFTTIEEAVARCVETVAATWPLHAQQQVVWRVLPEVTANSLYMRLVATPVV